MNNIVQKNNKNKKWGVMIFLTIVAQIIFDTVMLYLTNTFVFGTRVLIDEDVLVDTTDYLVVRAISFFVASFLAMLIFSKNLSTEYYKKLYKWCIMVILVIIGLPSLIKLNISNLVYIVLYIILIYINIKIFSVNKFKFKLSSTKNSFKVNR